LDRQVKLAGREGALVLECSELGPPGPPGARDVRVIITVDAGGFSAGHHGWIVDEAWRGFLAGMRRLEAQRQGRAVLRSASPGDLELEFFSTDAAGHMAVKGQVRRRVPRGFDFLLQFGFAFEPDQLPQVLMELETFCPQ
jgi:hypothetical protein